MVNLFHGWNNFYLKEEREEGDKNQKTNSGFGNEERTFDPRKTKIPVFPSISDALSKAGYGQIFTTPKSDNIYVITRGTWGEKSDTKVVKGFPPSTPYKEIKAYSERTKAKHGSKTVRKDEEGREEAGFATKKHKDDVKNFKPVN